MFMGGTATWPFLVLFLKALFKRRRGVEANIFLVRPPGTRSASKVISRGFKSSSGLVFKPSTPNHWRFEEAT